ncbi:hypothetical protein GCM10028791_43600 [Echinicola sediminis]
MSNDQLELNQERFELLNKSRLILTKALSIEEKYDIIISNYLAVEKEVLNRTVERAILSKEVYKNSHELSLSMNRLFINLLSAIKMYRDQIYSPVKTILADNPNTQKDLEKLFSDQYDNYFEFRFIDALRNHAQHGGKAVHKVTFRSKSINSVKDVKLQWSITVWSLKSELEKNSGFKKSVLRELGNEANLILYCRKYLECLSACHSKIRDLISDIVENSRDEIISVFQDFQNSFGPYLDGIYMHPEDCEQKVTHNKIPLLLDWDNERIELFKKNRPLNNLHSFYFSSI